MITWRVSDDCHWEEEYLNGRPTGWRRQLCGRGKATKSDSVGRETKETRAWHEESKK